MSDKRELSRSEAARQRRANRTVRELEQTKQRATRPVTTVVSRVPRKTSPEVNMRRVENLRRFNVALGTPGMNLRAPIFSMEYLRTGWRMTSLLTVLILGIVIYLVLSLPYFRIPNVTVMGNERLTREEIGAVTGLIGQSIFTVQPQEAEARLRLNYPELSLVEVKTYLPNHVYVTIQEREPVIFWQQDEGYTWIDAGGVAFRPRGVTSGLILVNGLGNPPAGTSEDPSLPAPFMQEDLVAAVLALAPSVPGDATMFYDPKNGLGWEDTRGWNAYFGTSVKDMPLKVRVYESLVESLMSQGKVPSIINVAYPEAPFYRAVETEEETVSVDSGQ